MFYLSLDALSNIYQQNNYKFIHIRHKTRCNFGGLKEISNNIHHRQLVQPNMICPAPLVSAVLTSWSPVLSPVKPVPCGPPELLPPLVPPALPKFANYLANFPHTNSCQNPDLPNSEPDRELARLIRVHTKLGELWFPQNSMIMCIW